MLEFALELFDVLGHGGQVFGVGLLQHPGVVYYLIRLDPLAEVDGQQTPHQILSLVRDVRPVLRIELDAPR